MGCEWWGNALERRKASKYPLFKNVELGLRNLIVQKDERKERKIEGYMIDNDAKTPFAGSWGTWDGKLGLLPRLGGTLILSVTPPSLLFDLPHVHFVTFSLISTFDSASRVCMYTDMFCSNHLYRRLLSSILTCLFRKANLLFVDCGRLLCA